MNLNRAELIGRVTRDPELKALSGGTKVVSFSLATNNTWKDANGVKKEDTDFHNIVAFGKVAETIGTYVKKGQLLFVAGRIKTRSWDDKETGKKQYRTEIMVVESQFGPKAGDGSKKPQEKQAEEDEWDGMHKLPENGTDNASAEDISADDIPF